MSIENELRKGNYALAYGKDIIQCTGVAKGLFYFIENGIEDAYSLGAIEGVPLTPEVLKGCDFSGKHDRDGFLFWKKVERERFTIDIYQNYTFVSHAVRVKHCKYVHQLQNLYFSLNGIELKLNQPA